MILKKFHENRDQVRQIGIHAVAAAGRVGVPVYYRIRGRSGEIVREMPDGKREVVHINNGQEIVIRRLKPRKR